jgi:hypothetical protein
MSRCAVLVVLALLVGGCRALPTAPLASSPQLAAVPAGDDDEIHPCEVPDFSDLKAVLYSNGRLRISGSYAPHCGNQPTHGFGSGDWSMHVVLRATAYPHWRVFSPDDDNYVLRETGNYVDVSSVRVEVRKRWFYMDVPTSAIRNMDQVFQVEWTGTSNPDDDGDSFGIRAVLPIQRPGNTDGFTPEDEPVAVEHR